jgi:predicted RNase H-like nuclease (RuvC/YqgF family)
MAKPRKAKLKVYCTPVGFHDAYVAAPSQKAALEAWGAKTNLFAQGAAHLVTDEKLTKAPLQRPGEVIKVLRGSDAEQLAALGKAPSRRTPSPNPLPPGERAKARSPKPSRRELTKAEEALKGLEERQSKQLRGIEEQERQLQRKRRELQQRQAKERDKARERVESEKENYDRAVRRWADGA